MNQFCLGPIWKYRGNSYRCIAGHCISWFSLLSPPAPPVVYQHNRGWGKSSFMSDVQITYLTRKNICCKRHIFFSRTYFFSTVAEKSTLCIYHVVLHENIAISLSVLQRFSRAVFFSKLTEFEYSHRSQSISYTMMFSTIFAKDLLIM